jgi:hypothetical protein
METTKLIYDKRTGIAYDPVNFLPVGNVDDINIVKGKYRITLSVGETFADIADWIDAIVRPLANFIGSDLSPAGKRVIIENIVHIEGTGKLIFYLDVQQNPIPFIVIFGAIAGIIGLAITAIIIYEIVKLVEDIGGTKATAIGFGTIALAGFAIYVFAFQ